MFKSTFLQKGHHWSKLTRALMIAVLVTALLVATIPLFRAQNAQASGTSGYTTFAYLQQYNATSHPPSSFSANPPDIMDVSGGIHVASSTDPTIVNSFGWGYLQQAVSAQHAKGKKAGFSLGSVGNSSYPSFSTIVNNSTLLNQLVTNIKNILTTYNADNINIDWEQDEPQSDMDKLLNALYPVVHPLGKTVSIAGNFYAFDLSVSTAQNSIDYIMPMAYDFNYPPYTLPDGAVLTSADKPSSYNGMVLVMTDWIQGGYPKNKLLTGIQCAENSSTSVVTQKTNWTVTNGLGGMSLFEIGSDGNHNLQTVYNILSKAAPSPTPTQPTNPTPTQPSNPTPTQPSNPTPTQPSNPPPSTNTPQPLPAPAPVYSGGGGAPPPPKVINQVTVSGFTSSPLEVDASGNVQASTQLSLDNGNITLDIAKNTRLIDANGQPLKTLSATKLNSLPQPPPQSVIILAYQFGPDGAQFNPSLTLTVKYDPQSLPSSVNGNKVTLAYWDGSQWVTAESTVDNQTNTVTSQINHFSQYALLAELAPAKFTVSDLKITEDKSSPDDPVTIQTLVTNTGGSQGEDILNLTLNTFGINKQEISLEPGQSQTVSFELKNLIPGKYSVDINGRSGEFTIDLPAIASSSPTPKPALADLTAPVASNHPSIPETRPTPPVMWVLLGVIVALILITGIFIMRHKSKIS